ncbi:hypothetical protein HZB02_07080 [Candidatus Woesearchaeota archaeon]|nr:hypothetical protein [Candidatus Woesearchaeota archaeon]
MTFRKHSIQSIALFLIWLVISLPLVSGHASSALVSSVPSLSKQPLQKHEQRIYTTLLIGDGGDGTEPEKQSNWKEPGKALKEKINTYKAAGVFARGWIKKLQLIIDMLAMLCTVSSVLKAAVDLLTTFPGDEACQKIPILGHIFIGPAVEAIKWVSTLLYSGLGPMSFESWCKFITCDICGQGLIKGKGSSSNGGGSSSGGACKTISSAGTETGYQSVGGALDPYNNLLGSVVCLCLPGLLNNLKKLGTIYRVGECCLELGPKIGYGPQQCEKMVNTLSCEYLWGQLYGLIRGLLMLAIKIMLDYVFEQICNMTSKLAMAVVGCLLAATELYQIANTITNVVKGLEFAAKEFGDPKCESMEKEFQQSLGTIQQNKLLYANTLSVKVKKDDGTMTTLNFPNTGSGKADYLAAQQKIDQAAKGKTEVKAEDLNGWANQEKYNKEGKKESTTFSVTYKDKSDKDKIKTDTITYSPPTKAESKANKARIDQLKKERKAAKTDEEKKKKDDEIQKEKDKQASDRYKNADGKPLTEQQQKGIENAQGKAALRAITDTGIQFGMSFLDDAVSKKISNQCSQEPDFSAPSTQGPSTGGTNECHFAATTVSAEMYRLKLGEQYQYRYSFSVQACKEDIRYQVYLRGGQDIMITSGTLDINNSASSAAQYATSALYDEICVKTNDPQVDEYCNSPGFCEDPSKKLNNACLCGEETCGEGMYCCDGGCQEDSCTTAATNTTPEAEATPPQNGTTSPDQTTCQPGERQLCEKQDGVCQGASSYCRQGAFAQCNEETYVDFSKDYQPEETRCDGLDNNCNGIVDEGLTKLCEKQQGVCHGATTSCGESCNAATYTALNSAYEAKETSCDGLDNNCDGVVDEGCSCIDGEQRPCNSNGVCSQAVQHCENGTWSSCDFPSIPAYQTVETSCDGLDNNCDGSTDENLFRPCTNTTGVCLLAEERCVAGTWMCLTNELRSYQANETRCDGKDNDCDGTIDEGCTGTSPSLPSSSSSTTNQTQSSATNQTSSSTSSCIPTAEVCDGVDNDCNGQIDEGCGSTASSSNTSAPASRPEGNAGQNTSRQNTTTTSPSASSCTPHTEICNGRDDNCNGQIDESYQTQVCPLTLGVCANATADCYAGELACKPSDYGAYYEINETSCDGLDNNCDGRIDESLSKSCSSLGVCSQATSQCRNGNWTSCASAYAMIPTYEANETSCDGLDNNCDGSIDEGCGCTEGSTRDCGLPTGACHPGKQVCKDNVWSSCTDAVFPTPEICGNGIDEDCDGKDQECFCHEGSGVDCGTSIGECEEGRQVCINQTWTSCEGALGPTPEVCGDFLDNNCNGLFDEGCNDTLTEQKPEDFPKEINTSTQVESSSSGSQELPPDIRPRENLTTLKNTTLPPQKQQPLSPGTNPWLIILLIFILMMLGIGGFLWYQKKKQEDEEKRNDLPDWMK